MGSGLRKAVVEKASGIVGNESRIVGGDQPFDPTSFLDFDDVLLWGANHFADKLPKSAGWLVWDKKLGLKQDDFSDGEAAWHKRGTRLMIYRKLWNGLLSHELGEKRHHIMQKPVALMEWCLGFCARQHHPRPLHGFWHDGRSVRPPRPPVHRY